MSGGEKRAHLVRFVGGALLMVTGHVELAVAHKVCRPTLEKLHVHWDHCNEANITVK